MPNNNLVVIAAMARKGGSGKTTLSRALISAAVAAAMIARTTAARMGIVFVPRASSSTAHSHEPHAPPQHEDHLQARLVPRAPPKPGRP